MSGPTPMRSAADKPHNPSSFPGQCRWPSKHIHSQPHSGGIGRRRFHWGTDAGIYCVVNTFSTFGSMVAAAAAALRGPCRVHGHRFKKATIDLFVLPPPLPHPLSCVCFV